MRKRKRKSLVGDLVPDVSNYNSYIVMDDEFNTSRELINQFKGCKKVRITIEEL